MLQASTCSNNQFLNNSLPNNKVLHYIKYKSDKYNKDPYFKSSIIDKDRKIISQKINVKVLF